MVLRGYDRIEVDEYIEQLLAENAALRQELASGATARPAAEPAVREEQAPQHYDVDTPAEDSFGFRAEKLLRLAEREAAEMRTRATRDAEGSRPRRGGVPRSSCGRPSGRPRRSARRPPRRPVALKKQATQEAARVSHLHRTTKDELRRLARPAEPGAGASRPRGHAHHDTAGDAVATESSANTESPGTVASNP